MALFNISAYIFPVHLTRTVNIGESTSLSVTSTLPSDELRWRKDGSPNLLPGQQNKPTIQFENVTLADAGIYECHRVGIRNSSSGFMKLIVRRKYDI